MSNSSTNTQDLDPKLRTIRRADLIVSTLMIIVGLWFAGDSFLMSWKTIKAGHATVATSPGLFPFIVSTLIVLTSISVLVNAIRSGVSLAFLKPQAIKKWSSKLENWTPLIVMAYFIIYVFILVGQIPFLYATLAFGISMMVTFKATKLHWIILINVLYASFVIYCFTNFAYTKFPMGAF